MTKHQTVWESYLLFLALQLLIFIRLVCFCYYMLYNLFFIVFLDLKSCVTSDASRYKVGLVLFFNCKVKLLVNGRHIRTHIIRIFFSMYISSSEDTRLI